MIRLQRSAKANTIIPSWLNYKFLIKTVNRKLLHDNQITQSTEKFKESVVLFAQTAAKLL